MKTDNLVLADKVARTAASAVMGVDSFVDLRVTSGDDGMGNPIYLMVFVTDDDRAYEPKLRIALTQQIRDSLRAGDDEHFPLVQMMGRNDWARLKSIAVG